MNKQSTISYIAFLGPKGSYSHIAAIQYVSYRWDQIIKYYSCKKFDEIFTSIEKNEVKYGVIPIENSNSGLINETFNLLLKTQLILVAEITIPIKHCVLVNNKTTLLHQIQIIYSHPQPAQQCSKFLKNFSSWKIILCNSSSVAIKTVATLNQPHIAALGSLQGGSFYGLRSLLSKNLSNRQNNLTKFIVLKKKNKDFETLMSEKIMIIMIINQTIKTLQSIFRILRLHNITITFFKLKKLHKITSESIIILELIANMNNYITYQVLIKLRKISNLLKILGYYSSISPTHMIQI